MNYFLASAIEVNSETESMGMHLRGGFVHENRKNIGK